MAGSRDLNVATLTDRVSIDAVEYPTGEYPASFIDYSSWGETLTLLVDGVPAAGSDVVLRYSKLHTLDTSSSTLPQALEDVAAEGSAAFAALE